MQLKPYQQEVLGDLARFVEQLAPQRPIAESYTRYWQQHPRLPLTPTAGEAVRPYQMKVLGVPHVCIKVPTGGGKTYIGCQALAVLLGSVPPGRARMAVWLVPSLTILEQTLRALRDVRHPYRQRLNAEFGGRVEILDKAQLEQGQGVREAAAGEQLTVVVMSFDSLRTRSKERLKTYRQNGAHQGFVSAYGAGTDVLPDTDPTATINVLRALRPVVIVDESHNAAAPLAVEMLTDLRPAFILELTATPRPTSNIISFVNAQALKQEHMVKLPVVVYNHHDKTDVVNSALRLRQRLEDLARTAQRQGAPYVRPIVLFQAEAKNAQQADTYQKVKATLVKLGIPEDHVKIKTGDLDELGSTDLLAPTCPVRYIITVNALKEGWDCPFAYVLASLANRNSPVEVEQIVGRVLRQPRATAHPEPLLNLSYVLTASAQFHQTLASIVSGLNQAGFSASDCRTGVALEETTPVSHGPGQLGVLDFSTNTNASTNRSADIGLDLTRLVPPVVNLKPDQPSPDNLPASVPPLVDTLHTAADAALAQLEAQARAAAAEAAALPATITPDPILARQVKSYPMRPAVRAAAQSLRVPQFVVEGAGGVFPTQDLLTQEYLLSDFRLSKQRTDLVFSDLPDEMRLIDLAEQADHSYAPLVRQASPRLREPLLQYFRASSPNGQRAAVAKQLAALLSPRLRPVSDHELGLYLQQLLAGFEAEALRDAWERPEAYAKVIRDFVDQLKTEHALAAFARQLTTGLITVSPLYSFPERRVPRSPALPLPGTLYQQEEAGNELEQRMMTLLADANNLVFWTRNPATAEGFRINGPVSNHYPDFLALTKTGKLLAIETKGDGYNNADSQHKVKLGAAWEKAAGAKYKYFMVFDKVVVQEAYRMTDFSGLLALM